ncbi:MAG: hypothetical protein LBL59_07340 [Xanthomonadaceae bacterium]|jgi:hypothetical protein|nr:hypothetical protein [Xanthomonadaceae bacterium]
MSITVFKDIKVDIDVDDFDDNEIRSILSAAAKRGRLTGCFPSGDGDAARIETIIERAYLATLKLHEIPRELADLFYLVHGRSCP